MRVKGKEISTISGEEFYNIKSNLYFPNILRFYLDRFYKELLFWKRSMKTYRYF
jgi:hypothetical protein